MGQASLSTTGVGGSVFIQPMAVDMGLSKCKYGVQDPAMEEWLSRCAVGKLRANSDVSILQFRIELTRIKVRVWRLGDAFYLLSFCFKEKRDLFEAEAESESVG